MVSAEAKMTAARAGVVLSTVAAGVCVSALLRVPLFELHWPKVSTTITQSLFTTDIYTPVGEKHLDVIEFTEKCETLQKAFRVLQVSTIAALVLLCLAFLCGLFHLAPSFTKTNSRVRRVCGAPICILLLLTAAAIGANGYVVWCMYEKDTWCKSEPEMQVMAAATPAILREPIQKFAAGPALRARSMSGTSAIQAQPLIMLQQQAPVKVRAAMQMGDEPDCDPTKGCIGSYRKMGFEHAIGYRTLWAALGVVIFAMVVEMLVMAVGASDVPQAGITAEAAALLGQQDDERVI